MLLRLAAVVLSLTAVAAARAQAPEGFELTAIEQAYLDQVLGQWETQSGQIETFSCDFTQLVYDNVFGPGNDESGQPIAKSEGYGAVSYQRPDKGSFHVKELLTWDAKERKRVANPNVVGEHWVCDGESVFEYKQEQKQLVVRPIPPEMQGKNIADGPLPFLFGAEADKLKARYWLRVDPRAPTGSIWLAAMPKRQQDAANYRSVELMLDSQRMLPTAMRVTAPDNSQTTYTFKLAEASINSRMTSLWNSLFAAPKTPWGWTRIVEEPQTAAAPVERR
ncbi:hypothetical protein Pla108_13710 [Botrimarina colliarenosi]|uniref:Uncharacterized protein n=1 Tax=Botrimarina colliarenosi TaxID=2528001 RepID=A0A5C6AL93_9BACT|nr:hypothetical protein [Botrimarina colliarenosi]TWU00420.1 hypothetical protein Pla108_13710 [Botrimarina colliarenosi]